MTYKEITTAYDDYKEGEKILQTGLSVGIGNWTVDAGPAKTIMQKLKKGHTVKIHMFMHSDGKMTKLKHYSYVTERPMMMCQAIDALALIMVLNQRQRAKKKESVSVRFCFIEQLITEGDVTEIVYGT